MHGINSSHKILAIIHDDFNFKYFLSKICYDHADCESDMANPLECAYFEEMITWSVPHLIFNLGISSLAQMATSHTHGVPCNSIENTAHIFISFQDIQSQILRILAIKAFYR